MNQIRFGPDSFIGKSVRPWPNGRLRAATIVGHTTPTRVRLWVRTDAPGQFTLLYYPWTGGDTDRKDPFFRRFNATPFDLGDLPAEVRTQGFEVADWSTDTTTVIELSDLSPDTTYRYAVYQDHADEPRIIIGRDRPQQLRTFPAGGRAPVSFALFSCHRPFGDTKIQGELALRLSHTVAIWDLFLDVLRRERQRDLRFVIGGGDQVYVDTLNAADIWRFLNSRMRRENGRLLPDDAAMLSWYRDVYRGFWNFNSVRAVLADFPTYMTWDDHEILDGWGSHYTRSRKGMKQFLPDLKERELNREDGMELIQRMFAAASRAYREYQHSHNPQTPEGEWDYSFTAGSCAFYVLDTRGHRDLYRRSYRILGSEQFKRFRSWLAGPEVAAAEFVFVVSAVPVVHLRPFLGDKRVMKIVKLLRPGEADDLRDSWENHLHRRERAAFLKSLFSVAQKDKTVAVLSGDVHAAASFRLRDDSGASVWQLTSSAITYTQPRILGWILGQGVPEEGRTDEGYVYERVGGVYSGSNFSIIRTDPGSARASFELYGLQRARMPQELELRLGELREAGVLENDHIAEPVSTVVLQR